MSATILGNPTHSDIPGNQNNQLVGGEIPHEALRSLYLKDVIANSQTEGSFVTFTRAQEDFPSVKKLNPLNKKRILVTGVSTCNNTVLILVPAGTTPYLVFIAPSPPK